jgi:hypothetical protein
MLDTGDIIAAMRGQAETIDALLQEASESHDRKHIDRMWVEALDNVDAVRDNAMVLRERVDMDTQKWIDAVVAEDHEKIVSPRIFASNIREILNKLSPLGGSQRTLPEEQELEASNTELANEDSLESVYNQVTDDLGKRLFEGAIDIDVDDFGSMATISGNDFEAVMRGPHPKTGKYSVKIESPIPSGDVYVLDDTTNEDFKFTLNEVRESLYSKLNIPMKEAKRTLPEEQELEIDSETLSWLTGARSNSKLAREYKERMGKAVQSLKEAFPEMEVSWYWKDKSTYPYPRVREMRMDSKLIEIPENARHKPIPLAPTGYREHAWFISPHGEEGKFKVSYQGNIGNKPKGHSYVRLAGNDDNPPVALEEAVELIKQNRHLMGMGVQRTLPEEQELEKLPLEGIYEVWSNQPKKPTYMVDGTSGKSTWKTLVPAFKEDGTPLTQEEVEQRAQEIADFAAARLRQKIRKQGAQRTLPEEQELEEEQTDLLELAKALLERAEVCEDDMDFSNNLGDWGSGDEPGFDRFWKDVGTVAVNIGSKQLQEQLAIAEIEGRDNDWKQDESLSDILGKAIKYMKRTGRYTNSIQPSKPQRTLPEEQELETFAFEAGRISVQQHGIRLNEPNVSARSRRSNRRKMFRRAYDRDPTLEEDKILREAPVKKGAGKNSKFLRDLFPDLKLKSTGTEPAESMLPEEAKYRTFRQRVVKFRNQYSREPTEEERDILFEMPKTEKVLWTELFGSHPDQMKQRTKVSPDIVSEDNEQLFGEKLFRKIAGEQGVVNVEGFVKFMMKTRPTEFDKEYVRTWAYRWHNGRMGFIGSDNEKAMREVGYDPERGDTVEEGKRTLPEEQELEQDGNGEDDEEDSEDEDPEEEEEIVDEDYDNKRSKTVLRADYPEGAAGDLEYAEATLKADEDYMDQFGSWSDYNDTLGETSIKLDLNAVEEQLNKIGRSDLADELDSLQNDYDGASRFEEVEAVTSSIRDALDKVKPILLSNRTLPEEQELEDNIAELRKRVLTRIERLFEKTTVNNPNDRANEWMNSDYAGKAVGDFIDVLSDLATQREEFELDFSTIESEDNTKDWTVSDLAGFLHRLHGKVLDIREPARTLPEEQELEDMPLGELTGDQHEALANLARAALAEADSKREIASKYKSGGKSWVNDFDQYSDEIDAHRGQVDWEEETDKLGGIIEDNAAIGSLVNWFESGWGGQEQSFDDEITTAAELKVLADRILNSLGPSERTLPEEQELEDEVDLMQMEAQRVQMEDKYVSIPYSGTLHKGAYNKKGEMRPWLVDVLKAAKGHPEGLTRNQMGKLSGRVNKQGEATFNLRHMLHPSVTRFFEPLINPKGHMKWRLREKPERTPLDEKIELAAKIGETESKTGRRTKPELTKTGEVRYGNRYTFEPSPAGVRAIFSPGKDDEDKTPQVFEGSIQDFAEWSDRQQEIDWRAYHAREQLKNQADDKLPPAGSVVKTPNGVMIQSDDASRALVLRPVQTKEPRDKYSKWGIETTQVTNIPPEISSTGDDEAVLKWGLEHGAKTEPLIESYNIRGQIGNWRKTLLKRTLPEEQELELEDDNVTLSSNRHKDD